MFSQVESPKKWPLKAYDNPEFLHNREARTIRVNCELLEPKYRFRKYNIKNTIVFFGSARTKEPKVAEKELSRLEKKLSAMDSLTGEETKILKRARMNLKQSVYYQNARDLAFEMSKWAETLGEEKAIHICSGGGPGIMEAANRGALDAGANSVGLNISLPHEQFSNPYIAPELNLEFHYFFVRKYWFLYLAKAIVVFPGGFGTMDELFEILTLIQTGKEQKKIPIVLFGKDYWNRVVDFNALADWGYISENDLTRFIILESVEESRDYLIRSIDRDSLISTEE